MNEQELKEKLFDLIVDPPCTKIPRQCEWYDKQGHFCFLRDIFKFEAIEKVLGRCRFLSQIFALVEEARKITGEPPILSDEQIELAKMLSTRELNADFLARFKAVAKTQRDADVKF